MNNNTVETNNSFVKNEISNLKMNLFSPSDTQVIGAIYTNELQEKEHQINLSLIDLINNLRKKINDQLDQFVNASTSLSNIDNFLQNEAFELGLEELEIDARKIEEDRIKALQEEKRKIHLKTLKVMIKKQYIT